MNIKTKNNQIGIAINEDEVESRHALIVNHQENLQIENTGATLEEAEIIFLKIPPKSINKGIIKHSIDRYNNIYR